jgi:hypothetical protein
LSLDFWDGSKTPQPYPSHHVKFEKDQSLATALPFVVDFVSGKVDMTGDGVYITEAVSVINMGMTTDFVLARSLDEATYTSGEIHKSVSNVINALGMGVQFAEQYKLGGNKKYGPRWDNIRTSILATYPSFFTKVGVKQVFDQTKASKIDVGVIQALVMGGEGAVPFAVSAGARETVDVDGATESDIERMTYEESLDALHSGVKLLMANATNGLFLAGRGGCLDEETELMIETT